MSTIEIHEFSEDGDVWAAFGHHDLIEFAAAVSAWFQELYFDSTSIDPNDCAHIFWIQDPHDEEVGYFQTDAYHPDGWVCQPITITGSYTAPPVATIACCHQGENE